MKILLDIHAEAIQGLAAQTLPITLFPALIAGTYAHPHRDPFDRMLAAQSQVESLPLVTKDNQLKIFPIELIW